MSRTTSPTVLHRLSSVHLLLALVVVLVLTLSVGVTTAFAGQVDTKPPAPVPLPDVHNVEFDGTDYDFTHPYLPPVSASKDYRVGLMRKIGSLTQARFVLYAPEKLAGEVLAPAATAGSAVILGAHPSTGSVNTEINISNLHADSEYGTDAFVHHLALCDPDGHASDDPNPQVCDVVDEHGQTVDGDCYTLYAITATTLEPTHPDIEAKEIAESITIDEPALRLWSRELLVKVVNPKTANAYIASVTPQGTATSGDIVLGGSPDGFGTFHTVMIVGPESRLLIARLGFKSDIVWSDGTTPRTDNHDIAYSYNASKNPCDVDGWTSFKPLAFAPEDAELRDPSTNEPKVGLAAYPFRSPSGAAIDSDPAGGVDDIPGRYIWVDQDADNIFFASLSRTLFDRSTGCQDGSSTCDHLYDLGCVASTSCSNTCTMCTPAQEDAFGNCPGCSTGEISVDDASSSATPPHQGWMMMGLWTHGKMVLLDSMVNHTDFGLRGREEHHRELDLFSTGDDVRVGFGRDAAHLSPIEPGWIDTTVQFHSTENLLNTATQMTPRRPRDVVWQVTAGSRSDEIAFDDYVSHRTLIFSPMNALKEMVFGNATYYDGNDGTEMRLQNAATSLQLPTPAYGHVVVPSGTTDKGRIENVALGGVKARGFYLDPSTRIDYAIDDADQQLDAGSEWILSLFYDRRVDPVGKVRRLFTFDNGTSNASIDLHGITTLRICGGSPYACSNPKWPNYVTLPSGGQANWTHLAFHVIPDATEQTTGVVRVYQDGYLFAEVPRPSDLQITDDMTLRVGSPDGGTTLGIGGWIDELRVVKGPFTLEEICNHAGGTLVGVPYGYATMAAGTERLADILAPFVAASSNPFAVSGRDAVHREVYAHGDDAYSFSDYSVCNVDYSTPEGVSLHDPGDDEARSLRQRSTFPEGPVQWNEPRPSTAANQFCLGCHSDDEEMGLKLAPLAAGTADASAASEPRQPLQPPREVFGMIPSHFVASDKPASAIAPSSPQTSGTLLDQWADDGPLYHWPLEEVILGHLENWGVGADHGDGTRNGASWQQKGLTAGGGRGYVLRYDGSQSTKTSTSVGDTAVDLVDRYAISLSAWIQPNNATVGSTPASQCNVASPCTVIAKADPVAWSLEIYSTDPDESVGAPWQARLRVRADGATSFDELVVTLDDPSTTAVDDFDPYAWHHILGTRADGSLEIILDGDSQGTGSASTSYVESSSAEVRIGSSLDSSNQPIHGFYGSIDDVRIYDRALTDAEVTELVTSTP